MQNVELSENIRTAPILFGSKSLVKKSPLGTIADYYTKRLNLLNVDRHKYLLLNEFKSRTVIFPLQWRPKNAVRYLKFGPRNKVSKMFVISLGRWIDLN